MKRMIEDSILTDIANAIREKNNSTETYQDIEMAQAVRDIQGGEEVFFNANGVAYTRELHFPNTVTKIGKGYAGCTELVKVVLNERITEICTGAFTNCQKLKEINIPLTVKTIGNTAFMDCTSLRELYIPEGVTLLASNVINGSGIKTLYIPSSINSIGWGALGNCWELEFVTLGQGFNCNGLDLSSSKKYSRETIVSWFEALADRTGLETYALIIGPVNILELIEADVAIATNKNWTVA
jgi:hypothetical protein